MEYLLRLPFEEGIELIRTAQKQWQDEQLYARWIASGQLEDFSAFKAKLISAAKTQTDTRKTEEIVEKVNKIISMTAR